VKFAPKFVRSLPAYRIEIVASLESFEHVRCFIKEQIQSVAIELYKISITAQKKAGKIAGF